MSGQNGHAPVPPQNLEAEESILGACMMSPGAITACRELLNPGDFYRESHARIWQAVLVLDDAGQPVDAITLTNQLNQTGRLDDIGGRVRLHELAGLVPASANAAHYAAIVVEQSRLRGLIRASGEIARLGWDHPAPASELVDRAQQITLELGQRAGSETVPVRGPIGETFQRITDLYERGGETVGLTSGFRELDRLTSGFQPGNLIVLAARPSIGKSGLVHAIVCHVAVRQGLPVVLFSPEMSRSEVAQRLLSREARVDLQRLRSGRLNADDWPRLTHAAATLERSPIHVNDTGDLGLATIRAESRRLKQQHPTLALLVVDYLQLLSSSGETRNEEVAKLSRGLKVLARDLEVPVIALSQLNRGVESRTDKRPLLSDLRDSGAVEQDADLVCLLYRDDYYNRDSSEAPGVAELNLAKNRNGPTSHIRLAFRKAQATFTDLAAA